MKALLSFFLSWISLAAFPQDPPIKWKEIAMEDLQMTEYPPDPSASAVILCDYGQRYFDTNPNGSRMFHFIDRHVRIKILKPEGLKYAKVRIPHIDKTCDGFIGENSITIKGMSYKLNKKGELTATRLKQKHIKYKDSTDCYRIAEFELPDAEPGAVIEYRYTIPTLDLISPQDWNFQNEIPTVCSEFRMRVPTQFSYMFSPQNISGFDVNEEKYYNQSIIAPAYIGNYYNPRRVTRFYNMSGKQIRFAKYGIEKFEQENFTSGPEQYIQSLKIHLVQATRENMDYSWERLTHSLVVTTVADYDLYEPKQRFLIPYPAPYIFYRLPDWEKFNQKMIKSDRFGLPLIKHWNHEEILKEIIEGKDEPEEKLIAIHDYLRKNMDWNGKYQVYVNPVFNHTISKFITRITKKLSNEKTLRKPFEKGEGTSSEINFLLIYLLNKAGIETHPVIIRTKDKGSIDTLIPDVRQFNHVLAMAQLEGKKIFLDATDSLRPYTLIDKSHLTSQGFLVKNDNYEWLSIENTEATETKIREKVITDERLNYTSEINVNETGYFAYHLRLDLLKNGMDKLRQNLGEKYSIENAAGNIRIKETEADTAGFSIEITKSGKANSKGEILLKPGFIPRFSSSDFKDTYRKLPLDLGFPFKQSYEMEIQIPEGYYADLPEKESFTTYGDHAGWQYSVRRENNRAIISITLEFKLAEYPAHEYENLSKLFSTLEEKLNEEIVIEKL